MEASYIIDGDDIKVTGSLTLEGTKIKLSSLPEGSTATYYMLTNAAWVEGLTLAQVFQMEGDFSDDEWTTMIIAKNG